jgi:UDP-2,3-diacylglucosamine hydrolase
MIGFISDLHLSPTDPGILDQLKRFIAQNKTSLDALYVLGDLFEYWLGDDASDYLGHTDAERVLAEVSAAGTKLFFMHGNRDFLVGEDFAARVGAEILPDPSPFQIAEHSAVLSHGDLLCTDDVDHQAFRKMTLNSAWRNMILAQSIEARDQKARGLRLNSEEGKLVKSAEIMDVNEGAVQELFKSSGATVLIHGHTHRPAIHHYQFEGVDCWRVVLGAWHREASYLVVDQRLVELHFDGQCERLLLPDDV